MGSLCGTSFRKCGWRFWVLGRWRLLSLESWDPQADGQGWGFTVHADGQQVQHAEGSHPLDLGYVQETDSIRASVGRDGDRERQGA